MPIDHHTIAADETLAQLLRDAVTAVRAAEGSLLLLDDAGRELHFVVVHSPTADKLRGVAVPLSGSITGLAVSLQQPMVVNDVQASTAFNPEADARTGTRTESLIAVPLSTPRREYGAITAINASHPDGFQKGDLDTYCDFAARICERLDELAPAPAAAARPTNTPAPGASTPNAAARAPLSEHAERDARSPKGGDARNP